jgi:WhiB family redox-sensing transcriptional regulator
MLKLRLALFESTRGQGWMRRAKCRDKVDVQDFFSSGMSQQRAKDFCTGDGGGGGCPVLELCRRTSIANHEEYGVWGGLSPDDRRRARVATHV